MKKILLPIDGSKRSEQSVELVLSRYNPKDYELILMIVVEDYDEIRCIEQKDETKASKIEVLKPYLEKLHDFKVTPEVIFGRPGEEIVDYADKNDVDLIVITKSTKPGFIRMIGSVSTHVVKYANCAVMIVPEKDK